MNSDSSLSGEATASDSVSSRASQHYRLHTRANQHAWAGVLFGMPMLDADQIPFLSGSQISSNNDGTFTHRAVSGNEVEQEFILTLSRDDNGGLEFVRVEAKDEWTLQSISGSSQGGADAGALFETFVEEESLIQEDDSIRPGCCCCFGLKKRKE